MSTQPNTQANWVDKLIYLDRRWIFLLMGLAVMLPILFPERFRAAEIPSPLAIGAFEALADLEPGSRVLISFDYEPASIAELQPMATAFTWHAAREGHTIYAMALWPLGRVMMQNTLEQVVIRDFGPGSGTPREYLEGEDFVAFGYGLGAEIAIRQLTTDISQIFPNDRRGVSLAEIPAMEGVTSVQDMDLIISISAGLPGTKEWVQYAGTPYNISVISGCTGVQAPQLYPYYPKQMQGLLGAIKGAAEYETMLQATYPDYGGEDYLQGQLRMGPQVSAHVLILVLIVSGNILLFIQHRRRRRG
jgi:hypothetical protein